MSTGRRNGPGEGAAPKSKAGGPADTQQGTPPVRQSHYFIDAAGATTDDALLDRALLSIALAGCTCSPTVKVWRAAQYLRVEHEDACAVLAGGAAA